MFSKIKSIQLKVVILGTVCLLILAVGVISFSAYNNYNTALEVSRSQAQSVAESASVSVKAYLEAAMDAARTLSVGQAGMKARALQDEDKIMNRDAVNAELESVLASNPEFLAIYTYWLPDAFDGRDADFVNAPGHDQTGRFLPYWTKDNIGIQLTATTGYEDDSIQIMACPRDTLTDCLIDPYTYPVNGKQVLMTSVVYPIVVNGTYYGFNGIDIQLDFLQSQLNTLKKDHSAGQVGDFYVISNNGLIAAATGHPELVGESMEKVPEKLSITLDQIRNKVALQAPLGDNQQTCLPISVGSSSTPWTICNLVPLSAITQAPTAQTWRLVAVGTILALAGLVLLWFASLQLARPVVKVTRVAEAIARGDLQQELDIHQADEIGQLASAFRRMSASLQAKATAAEQIAQGNLEVGIGVESDQDVLGKSMLTMRDSIRLLVSEAKSLTRLALDGRLSARSDVSLFKGGYRDIVEGLNGILEAVASPLNMVANYVNQVSKGEVPLPISEELNGDFNLLKDNLNILSSRLREMLMDITAAANNLNTAATEILAATTQQASGATEQSAAISQTTTTVDEVRSISEQASQRALEVSNSSRRTVEVARAGQKAVQDTIESMAQIKERVEGIAENILALSEQTQQIGEIIATVNEIAAQSNMLALNASVEAARAGEHGKGFAVVAMEVRTLAEQSRQATAQVKSILSEIQKATNTSVMATEEGTKGVDLGVQLVAQTRDAIQQLSAVIAESAQTATQVVSGGQQQLTGIEQIAIAMQNINQVTMQSLASTRQAEKSAQNLSELARSLADTVAQYKF